MWGPFLFLFFIFLEYHSILCFTLKTCKLIKICWKIQQRGEISRDLGLVRKAKRTMPPMLQAGLDRATFTSVRYDQDVHTSWEEVSSTLHSPLSDSTVMVSSCFQSLFSPCISCFQSCLFIHYSLFPLKCFETLNFLNKTLLILPVCWSDGLLSLTLMGIVHAFEMKLSRLNSKSVCSCLFAKQRSWNWEAVWLHVLCKFILRADLQSRHQDLSCTRHFSIGGKLPSSHQNVVKRVSKNPHTFICSLDHSSFLRWNGLNSLSICVDMLYHSTSTGTHHNLIS